MTTLITIFLSLSCFIMTSVNAHTQPITRIAVMTFNIENGGTQVSFDKVVDAVKHSGADVVGIQEAWGNTARISEALGWKYSAPSQNIISRYPLFEVNNSNGVYVLAEVLPGRFVALANMHLPDEPYGPDMIKKGATASTVIANSKKVQLPTAMPFVKTLAQLANTGVPVFLTGDFNSPSHLDWKNVAWPVTKTIEDAGLIDSYREIFLDATTHPGYTWPAGRPFVKNAVDQFNPSTNDHPDRLDYIFTAGPSKVMSSEVIGESNHKPWPSDHRAVLSRFEVTPMPYAKKNLNALATSMNRHATPALELKKIQFRSGESIMIRWENAPGNRYDYISITPVGARQDLPQNTLRLYTRAKTNGSITYNAKNAKGNWLAWNKSEAPHWPLAPGKYQIQLMLDDSYTTLASTIINVSS